MDQDSNWQRGRRSGGCIDARRASNVGVRVARTGAETGGLPAPGTFWEAAREERVDIEDALKHALRTGPLRERRPSFRSPAPWASARRREVPTGARRG